MSRYPEAVDVASAGRMMEAYFRVALTLPPQPSAAAPVPSLDAVSGRAILAELRRRILRRS